MSAIQQMLIGGAGGSVALYWRIDTISVASFLEISEVQFFNGASRLIGTMTSSVVPEFSTVSALNDNDLLTRCYWDVAPTLWIALQLGTPTQVNSIKLGAYDNSARYPTAFTLKKSDDGVTWTTVGSVSGLTYPGEFTFSAAIPF